MTAAIKYGGKPPVNMPTYSVNAISPDGELNTRNSAF
jgi:hypothetical protein